MSFRYEGKIYLLRQIKKKKKEKNYYQQTCTKLKVKKLPQQKDYDTNHICTYTHTHKMKIYRYS